MQYQHLTRDERIVYNRAIARSHERRIELDIRSLDGRPIASIVPELRFGQVDGDVGRLPLQTLTLTFADPGRIAVFEPETLHQAPVHRRYSVRVNDVRRIDELGAWIGCYVHQGPITGYKRQGADVQLTSASSELLATGTVRRKRVYPRKTRRTDVITELLTAAGARRLNIPDLPGTLPRRVNVGVERPDANHKHRQHGYRVTVTDTYLELCRELASSHHRFLYADAEAVFQMRGYPSRPVLHVDEDLLLSDPEISRASDGRPNVFQVLGGVPKGADERVAATAYLPDTHPDSREQLAWNGEPFEVRQQKENRHLKTEGECQRIAAFDRDEAIAVVADVAFDMLPVPWLRPHDLITVDTGAGRARARLQRWTLPLGPTADPMTIGGRQRSLARTQGRS